MRKNIKGYYTLEAAVFLPIFILTVLTIGYCIKGIGACENVMHAAIDESRQLASRAYVQKVAPNFTSNLESRIMRESPDISYIDVKNFKYLYQRYGNKGMISFNMDYRIDINLPLKLYDGINISDRVLCRGWIGKTEEGTSKSFDSMTEEDDSRTVWIFPNSGKKYHGCNCTFISSYPVQTLLNDKIKSKYKPCAHCKPGDLPIGSLVYCYSNYGEVYHTGSCTSVDKYTIAISKEQAENRGYTPCSKCGGK